MAFDQIFREKTLDLAKKRKSERERKEGEMQKGGEKTSGTLCIF